MSAPHLLLGMKLTPLPFESYDSASARLGWRNGKSYLELFEHSNKFRESFPRVFTQDDYWRTLTCWQDKLEIFQIGSLLITTFRYCPFCLLGAYHSVFFSYEFVRTCPIHGCELTDLCQHCGKKPFPLKRGNWLSQYRYRCKQCKNFLSGEEPSLSEHLILRDHATVIEQRFQPFRDYALRLSSHGTMTSSIKDRDLIERAERFSVFHSQEQLLRIIYHMHAQASEARASTFRGIVKLQWKIDRFSWGRDLTNDERTRSQAMKLRQREYQATLRRLEAWVFNHPDEIHEISAACIRFRNSEGNEESIGSWPRLVLTYCLLRYTLEGRAFYSAINLHDATIITMPPPLERWYFGARLLRVVLHAYLLGLFGVIHAIALKYSDWPIQKLFEGTGFPASVLTPILGGRVMKMEKGAIFFPKVDGMPLWPFVRRDRPMQEIGEPDGSECTVLSKWRR
ncbi:TniQ family protein [Duganella violaceipulchra]|uniref:TniQ family protein n=1 Tax=Duganella violaceipulchra TaxID=2849652 RepID=A0AA41HJA8_9BURK|nr:TniQ family protein [Duganella violaceicalia]MBV6325549.1 TniQ family protein [Duganella violaceicalia]MCP2012698.1 hypothetical protein [Duganella violaceicalia]